MIDMMTKQEKFVLIRGTIFIFGIVLIAYGLGANWIVVSGTFLAASAIPGMIARAGRGTKEIP